MVRGYGWGFWVKIEVEDQGGGVGVVRGVVRGVGVVGTQLNPITW